MAEYEIDNRMVYDILNLIYKDKDLYQSVKHHKTFHFRWLGSNHVNATVLDDKAALQTLTYDGKRKHGTGRCILPCYAQC